jgi:hypothetical protein
MLLNGGAVRYICMSNLMMRQMEARFSTGFPTRAVEKTPSIEKVKGAE